MFRVCHMQARAHEETAPIMARKLEGGCAGVRGTCGGVRGSRSAKGGQSDGEGSEPPAANDMAKRGIGVGGGGGGWQRGCEVSETAGTESKIEGRGHGRRAREGAGRERRWRLEQ